MGTVHRFFSLSCTSNHFIKDVWQDPKYIVRYLFFVCLFLFLYFFLSGFFLTDIDDSQDSRGNKGGDHLIPLPPGNRPKLCGNCTFSQNYSARKLGEITVIYAVNVTIKILCYVIMLHVMFQISLTTRLTFRLTSMLYLSNLITFQYKVL